MPGAWPPSHRREPAQRDTQGAGHPRREERTCWGWGSPEMLRVLLQQLDCPASAGHSRRCRGADRSARRRAWFTHPWTLQLPSPRPQHRPAGEVALRQPESGRRWAAPPVRLQSSAQPSLPLVRLTAHEVRSSPLGPWKQGHRSRGALTSQRLRRR